MRFGQRVRCGSWRSGAAFELVIRAYGRGAWPLDWVIPRIGAAIAKRLTKDGASVLVHYSASPDRAATVVAEIEKSGGTAEPVGADLSTADGPAKLLAQIARPPAVVSLDALTSL
jgi:short chain dehydrogenase